MRVWILAVAAGVGLAAGAVAADVSGPVRVIDADTLDVGGARVRLHGIDAPELSQNCGAPAGGDWPCGRWAAEIAAAQYDGRLAVCHPLDRDRYGRIVARCAVDGADIAAVLVRQGAAFAYRRYAEDYVGDERAARADRLGVWAGGAQAPERVRAQPAVPAAAPGGCAIKGNISSNGRIYHLPGQAFYDRTVIRESGGERWFCTEAEARAAGWRRAAR